MLQDLSSIWSFPGHRSQLLGGETGTVPTNSPCAQLADHISLLSSVSSLSSSLFERRGLQSIRPDCLVSRRKAESISPPYRSRWIVIQLANAFGTSLPIKGWRAESTRTRSPRIRDRSIAALSINAGPAHLFAHSADSGPDPAFVTPVAKAVISTSPIQLFRRCRHQNHLPICPER